MKVLQINTHDIQGGAARAAYRLHKGLQSIEVDSSMLVWRKHNLHDSSVHTPVGTIRRLQLLLAARMGRLPLKLYPDATAQVWSIGLEWNRMAGYIRGFDADLVHLHWISGFVSIGAVARLRKPIVWTLHDMWAFTGGCHYSGACTRYEQTCGNCPQLRSNREFDLSRWTWKRKSKVWADLPLTIVTPSKWLADCVNASSLLHGFRIETIPNGLDMTVYQPHDKQFSRQLHHLPTDKRLILFGALGNLKNERKGSQFLRPALQKLSQMGLRDVELVIVGAEASENAESFGLKTHYVGTLQDDASLSALYAAVDVFVAPSTQDNLPNTVVESLACGTPIVAFDIGGMPDIVDHHETGYLAQPYEADDLAAGIAWVLEDDERRQKLAVQARKVAEERFDIYRAARMYADLYQDILSH